MKFKIYYFVLAFAGVCAASQGRECSGDMRTHHFNFTIEWLFTMEPECLNCLNHDSDCHNPGCVVADGRSRLMNSVNRKLPGPLLEVCAGDKVIVDVSNHLDDTTTSLHWHGQKQHGTPHMDGVPMITQCPVMPMTTFRYEFWAEKSGTHFYHSHSGLQRANGLYGPFIVKPRENANPHKDLYDFDMAEHVIIVSDWTLDPAIVHFNKLYRAKLKTGRNSAMVVNGFGSHVNNKVPAPIFDVKKGMRYRFRIIHAGNLVCPIKLSIQDHNFTLISIDGNDIVPVTGDTLFMTNGERFDIVIEANMTPKLYWMKFLGLTTCKNIEGLALLKYDGSEEEVVDKNGSVYNGTENKVLGCLDAKDSCVNYMQIRSLAELHPRLKEEPDFRHYFGMAMYNYAKPIYRGVNDGFITTPTMNNITFTFPSTNLLEDSTTTQFCNEENRVNCDPVAAICECTNLLEIPFNSTVELVIVDEGIEKKTIHPMHMHGYTYSIIGQERLADKISVADVIDMDSKGLLRRNFEYPASKDTVTPPSGGYTILRFIADNPGYWLFHCHVEFHSAMGMTVILKVGDPPKPPPDFPKCGNYYNSL